MSAVLHESLGVGDADFAAALRGVAFHGFDVFVHAVVCPQPFALRCVASEHLRLRVDLPADVDVRRGRRQLERVRVAVLDGAAIVQPGNGRAGHERKRRRIGNRIRKRGRSCEQVRLLVIKHVIATRVRDDQRRSDTAEQVDRFAVGWLVEHHLHIGLFEAVVGGADLGGGSNAFAPSHGGDFFARQASSNRDRRQRRWRYEPPSRRPPTG